MYTVWHILKILFDSMYIIVSQSSNHLHIILNEQGIFEAPCLRNFHREIHRAVKSASFSFSAFISFGINYLTSHA